MAGLDLTFDNDGRAITDLGSNSDQLYDLISVDNGKILAFGLSNSSSSSTLIRYNADGSLDNSFGVGGKLDTGLRDYYSSTVRVAADGKINVTGLGIGNQSYIARFLANGQKDTDFGTNGLYALDNNATISAVVPRINPINKSNEIIINYSKSGSSYINQSILLDVNGKIKPLPIGNITTATPLALDLETLGKILDSETIDKTNPKVQNLIDILGEQLINKLRSELTEVPDEISVGALNDGSIVISFIHSSSIPRTIVSVARFNPDGKFDPNFGTNGLFTPLFPRDYSPAAADLGKKDGVRFAVYNSKMKEISVYSYTENGQLNSTFGNSGKVTLSIDTDAQLVDISLVSDSQNRILINTQNAGDSFINVFRINNNGTLDTSFGTSGKLQLPGSPNYSAILGSDDQLFLGGDLNGDIVISKYDIGGTSSQIPVNPTPVVNAKISQLTQLTEHLLQLQGGTETSLLKFTKIGREGVGKNQVLAFVVDDSQGRIGGIAPGAADYLAAALDKSQVIFSNLGNNAKDIGFDRDSQRYLNFAPGAHVQFALIADDTLDKVKADLANGKTTDKVLFSIPEANSGNANQAKFTVIPNNGGYEIAWEDNLNEGKGSGNIDFNDLVLKVETLDNFTAPIGTGVQGKSEGEVIDLRGFVGQNLKVDTISVSDAAYQNYIGFYAVEDAQGTLANGLKVGDIGYAEAAIKSAILRGSKTETQIDRPVSGGKIFAPVVIANGTFEDFLNRNPQNQANSNIHAYFNYLGANTDKVDHFRLLGDNKFGVEDLYGGGDRDYNDIVIQMNVKS